MASRKPLVVASPQLEQIQSGDSLGARSTVNGSTSNPTSTNPAFVVIPEMTTTVTTIGGALLVLFDATFHMAGLLDNFNYAIFLDGAEVAGTRRQVAVVLSVTLGVLSTDNQQPSSSHALVLAPSVGSHTVDVRWAQVGGTARANLDQRKLTVAEIF